jgi:hypothetical protein
MKTVDKGRFGPWEPMQGARGRAEAIQNEQSVAPSNDKNNANYRAAIRNPSKVKPAQIRRARQAARRGLTYGSNPDTADKASPF